MTVDDLAEDLPRTAIWSTTLSQVCAYFQCPILWAQAPAFPARMQTGTW